MKHIPEPDVVWLRDPGASVNRLTVHSTWRSRRPLQMLSSTWQVTGVSDTAAELIERTPHQRNFEATSVPGVLEMDGAWVRREEKPAGLRRLRENPPRIRFVPRSCAASSSSTRP